MAINKIFALFIVSLMLVGVFSAVVQAQDASANSNTVANTESTEPQVTDNNANTAEVAVKAKSISQTIEERIAKKKELLDKAKRIHEETTEKLKAVKDDLKDAREKLKESKKELETLKSHSEKCKGINSDECKKSRKDTKAYTAKMVDSSIEHAFRTLERARDAIENSDLSDDEKLKISADLDAKLADMNAMRQKQGPIQAQSSVNEIKDAAKNMQDFWVSAKDSIKLNNAKIGVRKLGNIISKMELLQNKLDQQTSEFKTEGKDTAELEAKVASFTEKLNAAKQTNTAMQSLIAGLDSAEDKSASMKEITGKMKEAQSDLKDARAILNDIKGSISTQNTLSASLQ